MGERMWRYGLVLAAAAPSCSFSSPGHGAGGADIMPTSSAGATSGDGSGTSETGSPDDGEATAGATGSPGSDGTGPLPPASSGDTTSAISGSSSGDASTGFDAASSSGSADGDTGPGPSPGYGDCENETQCGVDGELCVSAGPYHVCALPCQNAGNCPPSPGGTAPPECFSVGLPSSVCFLDCTQGGCPAQMVCNPNGHCSFQ